MWHDHSMISEHLRHQPGNSQQQLHQPPADTSLDDLVNPVVVAIRQVGQSPAGVCQHLLVAVVYQPGERGQGGLGLQDNDSGETSPSTTAQAQGLDSHAPGRKRIQP
jgi:hypothetical protein